MSDIRKRVEEAVAFIRSKEVLSPGIGIILGTGLGNLAAQIQQEVVLDYTAIPHFPASTC
jgi:purine-nucleoside phosphorylase